MTEKLIKLLFVINFIAFILVSCATTFRPYVGMTEENFIQHHRMVYWHEPIMSYSDEDIKVYTHDYKQFYYFENARLFRIDQGELQQEQIELDVK